MAAERGAHLTSTATTTEGDGQNKPSIFEVLAQENLMTSLRPAIKHVARVCGSNTIITKSSSETPFLIWHKRSMSQQDHFCKQL